MSMFNISNHPINSTYDKKKQEAVHKAVYFTVITSIFFDLFTISLGHGYRRNMSFVSCVQRMVLNVLV